MSISANLVKELREKTNAGMMDCKKALEATQGDFDAAIEWLRVKGLSSAAKKADRVAADGLIMAAVDGSSAAVVEVNSETDFVARNDAFKNFVSSVAQHVLKTTSTEALMDQDFHGSAGRKVSEVLKENIATVGENLVIRRFEKYTLTGPGYIHSYVHGEGKIGVLVELATGTTEAAQCAEVKTAASDICLHIAAMSPMAISSEQIPSDVVSKEREILKAKNLEQGKKVDMLDKIVEGQIRKFLAENCLVDQPFVKNPDLKVNDLLREVAKKAGSDVKVKRFVRFELGAGIEKKQNDFAAEVAAQMKGH